MSRNGRGSGHSAHYLSARQAAAVCSCSESLIRTCCTRGWIYATRSGRHWRIPAERLASQLGLDGVR